MPNGIYVTKVAEGSAAEKAGIQKGCLLYTSIEVQGNGVFITVQT